MGGRGGAGGGISGNSKNVRIPELVGSEKQVSWARNILTQPYQTMLSRAQSLMQQAAAFDKASSNGKGGDRERREAAAYKAASVKYKKEISSLPKTMQARDIIDKRSGLNAIANSILAQEFEKHGFRKTDAGRI